MAWATSLLPVSTLRSTEWRGGSVVSLIDYDIALISSKSCRHCVVEGRAHSSRSVAPKRMSTSPGLWAKIYVPRSPPRVLLVLDRSTEAAMTPPPPLVRRVMVAAKTFFFFFMVELRGLFERLTDALLSRFRVSAFALTVRGAVRE